MRETTDFQYLRRATALDQSVLRADPESYEARRLFIEIDMHKHDFPQAARNAQLLLNANPADTGMLGLLGDALMEMGKCDEAGEIYNRMASLGGNLFSYNRLAFHQFITGDMLAHWRGWRRPSPPVALPKNNRVAEARDASAKALIYKTPDPLFYYHAGMIASAAGSEDEARSDLQKALTLNPVIDFAMRLL